MSDDTFDIYTFEESRKRRADAATCLEYKPLQRTVQIRLVEDQAMALYKIE